MLNRVNSVPFVSIVLRQLSSFFSRGSSLSINTCVMSNGLKRKKSDWASKKKKNERTFIYVFGSDIIIKLFNTKMYVVRNNTSSTLELQTENVNQFANDDVITIIVILEIMAGVMILLLFINAILIRFILKPNLCPKWFIYILGGIIVICVAAMAMPFTSRMDSSGIMKKLDKKKVRLEWIGWLIALLVIISLLSVPLVALTSCTLVKAITRCLTIDKDSSIQSSSSRSTSSDSTNEGNKKKLKRAPATASSNVTKPRVHFVTIVSSNIDDSLERQLTTSNSVPPAIRSALEDFTERLFPNSKITVTKCTESETRHSKRRSKARK